MQLRSSKAYSLATGTFNNYLASTSNSNVAQTTSTPAPVPASTNPPDTLGDLGRLPGELRNDIYDLVIDTPITEQTDFHKSCVQRHNLLVLSKALHTEVKSRLEGASEAPCTQTNFKITLPSFDEMCGRRFHRKLLSSIIQRDFPSDSTHKAHDFTKAEVITFMTGNLGEDALDSVVCHLQPHGNITTRLNVQGGTDSRAQFVKREVMKVLPRLMWAVRNKVPVVVTAGSDDSADSKTRDARVVADALEYLADKVREVVCEPLAEEEEPRMLGP